MKTILKPLFYVVSILLLSTQFIAAQEEVWKEATIVAFTAPYDTIKISYDAEEFTFEVSEKTKFLLGKKKEIAKSKIFVGSTVDLFLVIENRKRKLVTIKVTEGEYGDVKKFVGVFESYEGDVAFIDGRKVELTNTTTIKCDGRGNCACSKGRSFLGFNELALGSFLTVYAEQDENGVYKASKIEVCKNTFGKIDQEYMSNLAKNFDASGLKQFNAIPKGIFKAAKGLHNGTIKLGNMEFKLLDDIRIQGYINMIGNRLLPTYAKDDGFSQEHEVDFRFYVIDSDVPNASALPNGMIFIHTGLLKLMENEAQIAAVLGHEIAHVTYEHGIREYKTTRVTNSNLGKKTSKWLKGAFKKKMNVGEGTLLDGAVDSALAYTTPENVVSLFNKKYETQSDRAGLFYMSEAGYDPREAANFWQIMIDNTGNQKFMGTVFNSTLQMINNLQTDLKDTNLNSLGEEGVNMLVKNMLETVYTSHPRTIKRYGDINNLLTTTYVNTDFSKLEIGKESFNGQMKKLKE